MQTQEFDKKIIKTYLAWYESAEEDRRWKVTYDIPWNKTTQGNVPQDLVSIVEAFCGIELVLPDYITEMLQFNRKLRGMSWYIANWGYEESKHSIALVKWLLDSGSRTEDQLSTFHKHIFQKHYRTHCRTSRQAVLYTMIQELATCISYVKLEKQVKPYEDDALSKLLYFVFRDEMAHHKFNTEIVKIHLEEDREGTLRELREEFRIFKMPAYEMIPEWKSRNDAIEKNDVMTPEIFVESIFNPILKALDISRKEWRKAGLDMKNETAEEKVVAFK